MQATLTTTTQHAGIYRWCPDCQWWLMFDRPVAHYKRIPKHLCPHVKDSGDG